MRSIILLSLISVTPTVAAQAQPVAQTASVSTSPELWRNIHAGMTVAEVRALYPAGDRDGMSVRHRNGFTEIDNFVITGTCKAEVNIFHRQGNVDRVQLRGNHAILGRCADTVYNALIVRNGPPIITDGNSLEDGAKFTWTKDGVSLRFFQPVHDHMENASWILEYRAAPSDIAL